MAAATLSLRTIMHRLYDASYVLRCGVNSLELRSDDTTDEQACLSIGIALLTAACEELDRVIIAQGEKANRSVPMDEIGDPFSP
jgi:hypothetical protein